MNAGYNSEDGPIWFKYAPISAIKQLATAKCLNFLTKRHIWPLVHETKYFFFLDIYVRRYSQMRQNWAVPLSEICKTLIGGDIFFNFSIF